MSMGAGELGEFRELKKRVAELERIVATLQASLLMKRPVLTTKAPEQRTSQGA